MWDEDLCDFFEVTTGVARLQQLVARFRVDDGQSSLDGKRRLLLMGAPGEQHTLGVRIVEQFLTRAGWAVSLVLSFSPEEITDLVASEWFGVVGLTLSSETRVNPLATAIRSVREASCNRAIGVMVGGPMFLQNPDLVRQVGADASAVDAPTAGSWPNGCSISRSSITRREVSTASTAPTARLDDGPAGEMPRQHRRGRRGQRRSPSFD